MLTVSRFLFFGLVILYLSCPVIKLLVNLYWAVPLLAMPNRFLRSAPLLCFDYVVFNKPGHLKLFQELLGNPSLAFRVLTVFEIPEEAYERGLLRCKFNLLTKRSWLFSLLKAAVSQDSWFYKGGPLAFL